MDLSEKTILVTGATDGIGRETAIQLADMGARVLIHGRDQARCESALVEIIRRTGNEKCDFVLADLASFTEIHELAADVRERTDHLDVLLNNAGVVVHDRILSDDGIEMTFAVNHLAYFLLTNLLIDLIKDSSPSRIVNVSSQYHMVRDLDFGNLQGEKHYEGRDAYARSKLCNILFTRELARRLDGTDVTANCLHPGVIATKLLHEGFTSMGHPVPEGARTPVFLASSPEVEGITGKYFSNSREASPSRLAQDDKLAQKLWDVSSELTGITTVI